MPASASLTPNEESFRSTGESYIEQVHVVNHVLLPLFVEIIFVDSFLHPFLAVVDRYNGQFVEGGNLWMTPQQTFQLQLPVAERNEHIGELQSFRLVDADKAYTVDIRTLDGL